MPTRYVNCPQCGHDAVFAPENAFRPFCSERCKLIDLGQWAGEGYKIPETEEEALLRRLQEENPD